MTAEGMRATVRRRHAAACEKHAARPEDNPGMRPHDMGMFEALDQHYKNHEVEAPEMAIWAEVAPFLNLQPEEGVEALAEYIVYRELPAEARRDWLGERVNFALGLESSFTIVAGMAFVNAAPWVEFLTPETSQRFSDYLCRVVEDQENA